MCPCTHSENMQWKFCRYPWTNETKTLERNQFNFSKTYKRHVPYMLICRKIKIDVLYVPCLLLALYVEENEKLQEKWDKVGLRNHHILPPFHIGLVAKMRNLPSSLSFRLIRSWPQLCLQEVNCRHPPMRTEVSASCTSILDCDAVTGSADHLRTYANLAKQDV